MADIEFTPDVAQDRAPDAQTGGLGTVANLAGAAISLALLVGVGVWAYKLMVRDVSVPSTVRCAFNLKTPAGARLIIKVWLSMPWPRMDRRPLPQIH